MLKAARDDIKKNYYDPALRGIDLEGKSKEAEEKIKQARSNADCTSSTPNVWVT
ncbi:hypothetical protein D3C83_267940 [compost metagenome]